MRTPGGEIDIKFIYQYLATPDSWILTFALVENVFDYFYGSLDVMLSLAARVIITEKHIKCTFDFE